MLGNKQQYNMAGGKVQPKGGGFDVNSLLSNPLLHAGLGLLGSKGNGSQAALQGLMQGQQYKQQQDELAKGSASQDRIQEVATKLQQQYAGSNPMVGTLLGTPETMQAGIGLIGDQAEAGGVQGSPIKLASGNLGYMTKTGQVVDTETPFYSQPTTFESGGLRYSINPLTGQSEQLVSADTASASAAQLASASTTAQQQAKVNVGRATNQPKAFAKLGSARKSAQNVLSAISEAREQTGANTTGLLGSVLSKVPGSEAFDLTKKVETIKANLGFDRLQQMRDESPTGGALGQVAVQELSALQATVRSLDPKQSSEELMKSFDKIELHYNNYLDALQKSYDSTYSSPEPAQSGGASVNWSDML